MLTTSLTVPVQRPVSEALDTSSVCDGKSRHRLTSSTVNCSTEAPADTVVPPLGDPDRIDMYQNVVRTSGRLFRQVRASPACFT